MSKHPIGGLGLTLAAWLFVGTWWTVSPAVAGETDTYGVAPHPPRVAGEERRTFGVPLEPGEVFADAVRVYNRTSEPITLSLYGADASVGPDGIVAVGFRRSRPQGLGAAMSLERNEVRLAPGADEVVPFTVSVPADITLDDLGAVVVENEPATAGALDVVQRVAVLVRPTAAGTSTGARRVDEDTGSSPWWMVLVGAAAVLGGLRGRAVLRRRRRRCSPAEPAHEVPSTTDEIPEPVLVSVAAGVDRQPDDDHVPQHGAAMAALRSGDRAPEPESPPTGRRSRRPAPPANRTGSTKPRRKKLNYIPLDDL